MDEIYTPPDMRMPSADSLEVQVGDLLRSTGLQLVLAESCTGGLISHRITNVPGSSDYYLGGINAYSYEAKERLLGVNHHTLITYGAVSQETVLEMARGARNAFVGQYPLEQLISISVSGIAGPGGGMPGKPVGLVWIGMSAPACGITDSDQAWRFNWSGNRIINKLVSAQKALELLLNYLHTRAIVQPR
jgi:PncC family amidohydrolase